MDMNEYQTQAQTTAIYPGKGELMGKIYCALKLAGESGEVAEKIGKVLRDNNSILSPEKTLELAKEIGDILWYVASMSHELGFELEQIAQMNISKLKARAVNNKLHGEGDNR